MELPTPLKFMVYLFINIFFCSTFIRFASMIPISIILDVLTFVFYVEIWFLRGVALVQMFKTRYVFLSLSDVDERWT